MNEFVVPMKGIVEAAMEVDMVYMILVREARGEAWLEFAQITGRLDMVKGKLEQALDTYDRNNVRLCEVRDFGVKMEVEL